MRLAEPTRPAAPAQAPAARMTWGGSVRAEAIRFWSLTGYRMTMLAALLSTGTLAGMEVAFWAEDETVAPGVGHTLTALSGILLTQLVVGVVGALWMTSEYAHGSIVPSLLAVPRRSWVLSTKAVVLATAVFPVTLLGGLLSFFATGVLIERDGLAAQSITDPGVLASIVGAAAYLTAVALIGLGIGTLLRSTAGAIAVVTGLIYIFPELAGMVLPASLRDAVGPYLPSAAGEALWTPAVTDELLSRPAAGGVMTAWLLLALGLGAVALIRRDA